MRADPAVELEDVGKAFGATVALRRISLRVAPGETLALLGDNGSGKTTLLKIMAGALAPTVGRGAILGRDLAAARAWRHDVGFLSSSTYLYDDLTARENLVFVATMAGRGGGASGADDMLRLVSLDRQADARVRNFSSGMKRRLALARVLLLRPFLLLLDEPYNSLDAEAADLVDTIVRSAAGEGRSVILATHDADRALALAGKVAYLERGALSFVGPAEGYRRGGAAHVG
jgi:heme exporter protein A